MSRGGWGKGRVRGRRRGGERQTGGPAAGLSVREVFDERLRVLVDPLDCRLVGDAADGAESPSHPAGRVSFGGYFTRRK